MKLRAKGGNIRGTKEVRFAVVKQLAAAPAGVLCLSTSLNPSPSNFAVMTKYADQSVFFNGTESLNGGFTDFTPYVQWQFMTGRLPSTHGAGYQYHYHHSMKDCKKLPDNLRSNMAGIRQDFCHKKSQKPDTPFVLIDDRGFGVSVDNDGAIAVAWIDSPNDWIALWY
jgi:hypothetical protein